MARLRARGRRRRHDARRAPASEPKAREPITGFAGTFTSATGARFQLTPTAASSAAIDAATASVVDGSSSTPSTAPPGYELPVRHSSRVTSPPSSSIPSSTSSRSARSDAHSAASSLDATARCRRRARTRRRPRRRSAAPSRAPRAPGKLGKMQAAASRSSALTRAPPPASARTRSCAARAGRRRRPGSPSAIEAAINAPQSVWRLEPRKYESQTVTVCFDWSFSSTRAKMYSFQVVMNANTDVATRPGPISGSRIFRNTPSRVEPSTIAASSSSFGIPIRKPRSVQTRERQHERHVRDDQRRSARSPGGSARARRRAG